MSKSTKQLYTFKPFILKEHKPKHNENDDDYEDPTGRCYSEIYYKGNNLYIYSGGDPSHSTFFDNLGLGDLWVFNLLSRKWTYIDNEYQLPCREHDEIGVIFEGNLLTICTIREPYSDKLTNLYIFNLLNGNVTNQPLHGEIPESSPLKNMIRDGGYYYFVGDVDDQNNFVGDVYRINMKSGIWECIYKCQGRSKYELRNTIPKYSLFNGKTIFTFFSLDYDDEYDENDDIFTPCPFLKLAAFDVQNRRWRMINIYRDVDHVPNYPKNECDIQTFKFTHYRDSNNDVIVIFSLEMTINKNHCNDLWKLNLSTMIWKNIDNRRSLIPRTFEDYSMTVSPAGQLFTFGGCIGSPSDRVPCCSRVHSVWITIPKLTDICWESIFHYLPSLVSMSQEQVENLGIPWKFFQSRIN